MLCPASSKQVEQPQSPQWADPKTRRSQRESSPRNPVAIPLSILIAPPQFCPRTPTTPRALPTQRSESNDDKLSTVTFSTIACPASPKIVADQSLPAYIC